MGGAFRGAGHATEGDADRLHLALFIERQVEGATERRNILVAAFRDLVDGIKCVFGRARHEDLFNEFAGQAVLLAIGDEKGFERQRAPAGMGAQRQFGAKRDQRRGRVADRRAVGDIAADRADISDLLAADPLDQASKRRDLVGEEIEGVV